MTDAWIGIDLGTQSLRAVALDDTGAVYGPAVVPLQSIRSEGRHEQDPLEWIRAARVAIAGLTGALPVGVRVRAIAVAGTSGTIVPVDHQGRPTGAATMYDDRRGAPFLDEVQSVGSDVWSRLGYAMQSSWALPRLLSMRSESGDLRFAHQSDVIMNYLAGRRVPTDLSSALKTGADLDSVTWPEDVLVALGIGEDELPHLVPSGTPVATLDPLVAAELRLSSDVALIAGATDGVAAQLASGVVAPGWACSVLGTTLVIKAVSERRVGDPGSGIYSHRAPLSRAWYPGGASNVGAGAISALLPDRDLAALTEAAAGRAEIPVSYPLVAVGERFPVVADTAAGFWPRDLSEMSDPELFRAIAFGVAFVERLAFDRLEQHGAPVKQVIATGGGARNQWWLGVRSTVLRRPVAVAAEPEGALGMSLLAAASSRGRGMDETVQELSRPPQPVDPVPLDDAAVEAAYASFKCQVDEMTVQA